VREDRESRDDLKDDAERKQRAADEVCRFSWSIRPSVGSADSLVSPRCSRAQKTLALRA
jgi:hypothetical protein